MTSLSSWGRFECAALLGSLALAACGGRVDIRELEGDSAERAGAAGERAAAGGAGAQPAAGGGGTPGSAGTNSAAGLGGTAPGNAGGAPAVGSAGQPTLPGAGGGGTTLTLAASCALVCRAEAALSCSFGSACTQSCVSLGNPQVGSAYPEDYARMLSCQAQRLAASDYHCSKQQPLEPEFPAPKAATPCEALICTWTCNDAMFVDTDAYARCGC